MTEADSPDPTVPDLRVELAGLRLQNPVMTASGTFGFGLEYSELLDIRRLGAIITKSVTLEPRAGNPPPRIWETPSGMLNAIGLQNPGVAAVVAEKLPPLADVGVPIVVNISGRTPDEYAQVAERLTESGLAAALEVNISCPNVAHGGMQFGVEPDLTRDLVATVRPATDLPLIVKLSPNVTSIVELAHAAVEGGADALSLVNTLLGMSIDVERRRPRLANVTGGLSGPAIRPVAVRMVWEVAGAVDVPIIGMGGIMTATDALEFLLAGATAVAVGTASFVTPGAAVNILDGLAAYCARHATGTVRELIGAARATTG